MSSEGRPRAGLRRQRLERLLAGLLGLPAALLIVSVGLARIGALDRPLQRIFAAYSERLGGRIEPEAVRIGLFPPRLTVERLALSTPDGETLLLELFGLDLRALPGSVAVRARGGRLEIDSAWQRLRPATSSEGSGAAPANPLGWGLAITGLRLFSAERPLGSLDLFASHRPWPAKEGGTAAWRYAGVNGDGGGEFLFEWGDGGHWKLDGQALDLQLAPLLPPAELARLAANELNVAPGSLSARVNAHGLLDRSLVLDLAGRLDGCSAGISGADARLPETRFQVRADYGAGRLGLVDGWAQGNLELDAADQPIALTFELTAERRDAEDPGRWRLGFQSPGLPFDGRLFADLAQQLEERGLERVAREIDHAQQGLDPSGVLGALGCLEMQPLEAPSLERLAVEFKPDRQAELRYVGWPEESGERHGFPVRARELTGRVLLCVEPSSGRSFELGLLAIEGQHQSGQVRCNGWIGKRTLAERGLRRDPRVLLSIEVPNMAVGRELEQALAGLGAGFELERYVALETGTVHAKARLDGTGKSPGLAIAVDGSFEGVGGHAVELAVPFENVAGAIALRVTDQAFEAKDRLGERLARESGLGFAARGNPVALAETKLVLLGSQRQERHSSGDLEWRQMSLEALRVDAASPALAQALESEPEVLAAAGSFAPAGELNLQLVRRQAGSPETREALSIESPGLSLTGLGALDLGPWSGRALIERTVQAEAGPGSATTPDDSQLEAAPQLVANFAAAAGERGSLAAELRFNRELELSLAWDGAGLSDPGLAQLAGLGAAGGPPALTSRFDVRARLGADREPEAAVWLRHNTLDLEQLRLADLDGRLDFGGGGLSGELIEGRLERTRLVLRDLALEPPGPERPGSARGRLWVSDLPLDAVHLRRWLTPEQLAALFERGRWRGSLDVLGAEFSAQQGPDGQLRAEVSGPFVPHDLFLEIGLPLRIASARVDLGKLIFEDDRVRAFGRVSELYGSLAGRGLADLSGVLSFSGGRLQLDSVSGQVCGGKLQGASDTAPLLTVDLSAPYPFELAADLQGASLKELLQDLFPGELGNRGEIDLAVQLSGEPAAPLSWVAAGDLRLFNARLWSVPVVRELFGALGFDATATFDWMRTRFRLEAGRVRLEDAVAHSPLFNLVGGGTLDLNGTLDQTYTLSYEIVDRLGFLSRLIYFFQDRVVRIQIGGDMGRPRVRLMNALVRLFGRRLDSTPRLTLPLARGLPERF